MTSRCLTVRWPSGLRRCTQVSTCPPAKVGCDLHYLRMRGFDSHSNHISFVSFFLFHFFSLFQKCVLLWAWAWQLSYPCIYHLIRDGIGDLQRFLSLLHGSTLVSFCLRDVFSASFFLFCIALLFSSPRLSLRCYHPFDRTNPSEILSNLRSCGISKDIQDIVVEHNNPGREGFRFSMKERKKERKKERSKTTTTTTCMAVCFGSFSPRFDGRVV